MHDYLINLINSAFTVVRIIITATVNSKRRGEGDRMRGEEGHTE
jgi:hypothetical protein